MRKVSKLALVLVALISFLCFLFYKSRYDKLYNVLEVLEFFGNDKVNEVKTTSSNSIFHPPSWKRISDSLYVYSAFCSKLPGSIEICPSITILALSKTPDEQLEKLNCQLWYDSSIRPIKVPVNNSPLDKDQNGGLWKAYTITCESKFSAVMPFGVSLYNEEFSVTKHQSYINVDGPPLASIDRLDKSKEILLCLSPQKERIDSTYQIMENVLLHLYFGVNFFHIYDNGLTNKFIQTLSQPHQKLSHLNIQILPWNVPDKISDQLMQHIVQLDCHMRAKSYGFQTNTVLDVSQIIVPKSGVTSIPEVLEKSQKGGQLIVDVLKFCREYPEIKSSGSRMISALQQTIFNTDLSSGLNVKLSHKSGGDQNRISRDKLAVHDYGACNNYDLDDKGADSVRDSTLRKQTSTIEYFMGEYFPMKNR